MSACAPRVQHTDRLDCCHMCRTQAHMCRTHTHTCEADFGVKRVSNKLGGGIDYDPHELLTPEPHHSQLT